MCILNNFFFLSIKSQYIFHKIGAEFFNFLTRLRQLDPAGYTPGFKCFISRYDWELRYLHVNYSQSLEEGNKPQQPCPDVYWFPSKKI